MSEFDFDFENLSHFRRVNLRKIRLTDSVIREVHATLIEPETPDQKADLLIATEELAEAVFDLLSDVRHMVWEPATPEE